MIKIIRVVLIVFISLLIVLEIGNVIYYYNYQKPNIDRIEAGGWAPWDLGRSYEYKPWSIKFYNEIFYPPEKDRMNT